MICIYEESSPTLSLEGLWPRCQAFSERSPHERVWLRGCWELSENPFEGLWCEDVSAGLIRTQYHQMHPAFQENNKTCLEEECIKPEMYRTLYFMG